MDKNLLNALILVALEVKAQLGVTPTVLDLRYIKPLDEELLKSVLAKHDLTITAEEASLFGGVGEKIAGLIATNNLKTKFVSLGVRDEFVRHAPRSSQWDEAGLTASNIVKICKEYLS